MILVYLLAGVAAGISIPRPFMSNIILLWWKIEYAFEFMFVL
jgi:hypothetical protein